MKIGINLLALVPGQIGGMEQYVKNLLAYSLHTNEHHEWFLFLNQHNFHSFQANNKLHLILVPDHQHRDTQLHHWIKMLRLNVWFCPFLILEPKYVTIPSVVTIPDIQHEFFPDFFDSAYLQWRRHNYQHSAQVCNAVLTLSEFSKKTIMDKYHIPAHKVHAIHLDSSQEFYLPCKDSIKQAVHHKYRLPDEFGFYPANSWPHKNHLNLLKATVILRDHFNKKINLVFTGSPQQKHTSIMEFIRTHQLTEQIHFLGYVPQEEMPYIYRNASFLVFPSLFEGFGIPLVEAMKSTIPIVCSNAGSIPEVVGDCALLFDPFDPEDIAVKIIDVCTPEIKVDLIRKGIQQAQKFSWEKCSQQTLEIFHRVCH